jgi:branched-chain amino acid transport system permease protein
MAGALYAMNYSTVAAKKFDFNTSILILVFVVLAAWATSALHHRGCHPDAAAGAAAQRGRLRMLVYAIVLILVMLARNSSVLKNYINNVVNGIVSRIKAPFGGKGERPHERQNGQRPQPGHHPRAGCR